MIRLLSIFLCLFPFIALADDSALYKKGDSVIIEDVGLPTLNFIDIESERLSQQHKVLIVVFADDIPPSERERTHSNKQTNLVYYFAGQRETLSKIIEKNADTDVFFVVNRMRSKDIPSLKYLRELASSTNALIFNTAPSFKYDNREESSEFYVGLKLNRRGKIACVLQDKHFRVIKVFEFPIFQRTAVPSFGT